MAGFGVNRNGKKLDIIVVGGGLVGSLETLYLAKRGHRVRLYEYRKDIRTIPVVRGRALNLALSVRGRRALKDVGLEDQLITNHGIPMIGRRIHRLDGSTYVLTYDTRTNQCIYSVRRNYLNGLLLTESEKYKNVERYYNHKLIDANLHMRTLTFLKTDTKETVNVTADLIIGADGAYSAVRKAMMKEPRFDYTQMYIEHGYVELCIPAHKNGMMATNYLHIWPRGEFMMIALPNQDYSWSVTLFMPFSSFKRLDTKEKLIAFFNKYFPDSLPLIGEQNLIDDFFSGPPLPMITVKCRPYNLADKVLLIGDAAHAIVPFYGQGMNVGFEDCFILDKLFQKHQDDLGSILAEFFETRWENAFAISDLALYNYVEMRDLVTRPSYRLRKALDDMLFWLLPDLWVPLYNSVTFTTMPYSRCIKNRQLQDKVLLFIVTITGLMLAYWIFSKLFSRVF